MPALAHNLTTVDKVKTLLGITGSTHDSVIELLVNQVTDFVESFCGGRRFKETTYTNEEYDAPAGDKVFLRQLPVTGSLSSVQYRSGTISTPTWNNFSADDYLLYGKEGYIKFFATVAVIATREKSLRFTYTAGYKIAFADETDPLLHTLPFDLTMAATQMAAKLFNLRASQGIKSESTEGQSVTYADPGQALALAPEVSAVLEKYKKHTITL